MNNEIFICPKCRNGLKGLSLLHCSNCGCDIISDDGILIFTDEPCVNIAGNTRKYIGFDQFAEKFEKTRNRSREVDSILAATIGKLIGSEGFVLDIGAGTGSVSIGIAKSGCNVIAGDI